MKYYKVINIKGWEKDFQLNKIYPENYNLEGYRETMQDYSKIYLKDFQEVPEIEYLLQKAREDYPEGTKFITYYGVIQTSRGVDFFQSKGNIYASTPKNEWILTRDHCYNPAVYYNGVWAKKVEEFVLPEKWCVKVTNENKEILNNWKQLENPNSETAGAFDNKYVTYEGWNDDIADECKEITFEQFKKYVLNSKKNMEKKIIGYKLIKPEYREAAYEICDVSSFNVITNNRKYHIKFNSHSAKVLEKAGVLDLWFESVYEKQFKIGDYVRWKGVHPCVGIIKGYNNYDREVNFILEKTSVKDTYDSCHISNLEKITEEEYKKEFIPQITINGYKAEFFDDYVKFGCAEIAVDHFKLIWDTMTIKPKYSNRVVDKVTIGRGEFNAEQIEEIVEYYRNK